MASKFWVNWANFLFFFLFFLGFAIKIVTFSKKMATRVALGLIRQSVFNVRRRPHFIPRHHYCTNAGPPPPPPPKIPHSSRKVSIVCCILFIVHCSSLITCPISGLCLKVMIFWFFCILGFFFFGVGDICDCSFYFAGYKAPFFPLNNGFMGWNFIFVHGILAVMIVKIGGGSKLRFFMS